jgi:hypothetical protein
MLKYVSAKELMWSSVYVDYDAVNNSYKLVTTDTKASAINLKIIAVRELLDSTVKVSEVDWQLSFLI